MLVKKSPLFVYDIFSLDEEKLDPDTELERILSLAQQQQQDAEQNQHQHQQNTRHNHPEQQDTYQQLVISSEQKFEKSLPEGKQFIQKN